MQIKKFLFFSVLLSISVCIAFSSESKIINEKNEYGGITIEYLLAADDPQFNQFYKVDVFYDESKNKCKEVYYVSEEVQNENGFLTQSNIFKEGKIVEYIIQLTEKESAKKGVKTLIEKVDENDKVYIYGYSDGNLKAYSDVNSFVNNYPLYSLNYIEKYFFETEDLKTAYYNLSAKYYKARTFVKIPSKSSEMTNFDKDLVSRYSEFMGDPDKAKLYNKKYQVKSGGKSYTVYMQDTLIPFLKTPYLTKDGECLLAYGIIGYKGKLYLIATEFSEVK